MVDVEEKAALDILSDKQSDFEDASDMLDDDMEKLAYSDSDVTSNDTRSVGFIDEEFTDALDSLPEEVEDDMETRIDERLIESKDSAHPEVEDAVIAKASDETITDSVSQDGTLIENCSNTVSTVDEKKEEPSECRTNIDTTKCVSECDEKNVNSDIAIDNLQPVANGDTVDANAKLEEGTVKQDTVDIAETSKDSASDANVEDILTEEIATDVKIADAESDEDLMSTSAVETETKSAEIDTGDIGDEIADNILSPIVNEIIEDIPSTIDYAQNEENPSILREASTPPEPMEVSNDSIRIVDSTTTDDTDIDMSAAVSETKKIDDSEIGEIPNIVTVTLSNEEEDELLKDTNSDTDNNLLEEMQDSPRSQNESTHSSSVHGDEEPSNVHDFNEDESNTSSAQVNEISIDEEDLKNQCNFTDVPQIDISSENSLESGNVENESASHATMSEMVSDAEAVPESSEIASADDNAVDIDEQKSTCVSSADIGDDENMEPVSDSDVTEPPAKRICTNTTVDDEAPTISETQFNADVSDTVEENDNPEVQTGEKQCDIEADAKAANVHGKSEESLKRPASEDDDELAPARKTRAIEVNGDSTEADQKLGQTLPTPNTKSSISESAFDDLFKSEPKHDESQPQDTIISEQLEPKLEDAAKSETKLLDVETATEVKAGNIIELKADVRPLILDPKPESKPERKLPLEFMKRFKRSFETMSRKDLEDIVLAKIVEGLMHKSDNSELVKKCDAQEQLLQTFRLKVNELSKQFRDLEMVHSRVVKDLESRNQNIVTPVKITRAVGLQVSLSKREPTALSVPQSMVAAISVVNQRVSSSTSLQGSPKAKTATTSSNTQQIQNNHRTHPKISLRPKSLENMLQTPPVPPVTPPQSAMQKHQQQQMLAKKKQDQLNKQKQIHQQIQQKYVQQQQQQALMAQAQQQVQQRYARTGNTLTKVDHPQRVPPVVLKKIATNGRLLSVQQVTVTAANNRAPPVVIRQNASSNCIDLTDEDDTSKQRVQRNSFSNANQPPALVSLQNQTQGRPRAMITAQPKVTGQVVGNRTSQKFGASTPSMTINQPGVRRSMAASVRRHPAPLPVSPHMPSLPHWKRVPPRPIIRINNVESGIVISWTMDDMSDDHAEITNYQIYAYQETTNLPITDNWKHVGDVQSMLLPMAVTLTQFQAGIRYHFSVRAMDVHERYGMFSIPRTWS